MSMRLDKFLKASRLIKRRTVAKAMCDQGRIEVNGRPAKAGAQVKVGDQLSIRYGHKRVTVTVDAVEEAPRKEETASLFTIVSEERIEE